MIKVVAKNFIRTDKVNEFIALARQLVEKTTKNDSGCIRYELFQDDSNPQILTIIEEWEDRESLNKHMTSTHFKEVTAAFTGFVEKAGEINLYQKLA
jgi:quinol monooxygenase YgiN